MPFNNPAFVITIVALCMGAWVITTFIRARHGYPLSDDWGNLVHPTKQDDQAMKALATENEQLRATIGKLEDRLKVLERIATDPAERVSREIEELR